LLGPKEAKKLYRPWKENGLELAPGNKQVAEWVSLGKTRTGKRVAIGITDTDDALGEIKAGGPVAMVFPDIGPKEWGTLYIPNTLCIPAGCPNPEGARKLVDFLLSAESEKALAEGPSGQIPLNPEVKAELPASVRRPSQGKAMEVNWEKAAELWDEAQEFVTGEFGTA
jgi:iron(III) transport system substrate-binding protein